MADITITDLDADSSVAESDLFLKRTSGGADYKTTAGKIKEYVKSALINEGTGSSSFATVAQIAKASGVSLTTGTSSVLGSTTVEVFNAIATYGKNTKSNVTAILSGLEIGDEGYTKYTNTSGVYESQLSVEIKYAYANGRGYAHIIPNVKNQQTYTMYMLSSNATLDGVWQKDTDKVLSETHSATSNFTNNIPFTIGKDTDTTGEQIIRTKYGSTVNALINIYRPAVHTNTENNSENNVYFGNKRNTFIGSGALGESAWSTNKTNKTNNKLYLTGQDGIELSTGSSEYSKATKSTLDKSGNLTIANNITANGSVVSTKDATANGATLVQNMYSKCLITNESSKTDTPYCLLAYKKITFNYGDSNVAKFHFTMNDSDQYFDCDLKFFARWSNETTATAPQKIGLYVSNVTSTDSLDVTKLFKLRYTFTPYTDSSNPGSIECWIYLDSTITTGYTYANIELFGKEENIFHAGNNVNADARTWTYYNNQANTADMLGTVTVNGQWAKENIGSLSVSSGRITDLTTTNTRITDLTTTNTTTLASPTLNFTAGTDTSVVFAKDKNNAVGFAVTKSGETTSTLYPVIDSSGELTINRARVSTTEPTSPVDGDMWFV